MNDPPSGCQITCQLAVEIDDVGSPEFKELLRCQRLGRDEPSAVIGSLDGEKRIGGDSFADFPERVIIRRLDTFDGGAVEPVFRRGEFFVDVGGDGFGGGGVLGRAAGGKETKDCQQCAALKISP